MYTKALTQTNASTATQDTKMHAITKKTTTHKHSHIKYTQAQTDTQKQALQHIIH